MFAGGRLKLRVKIDFRSTLVQGELKNFAMEEFLLPLTKPGVDRLASQAAGRLQRADTSRSVARISSGKGR
ncbi:MAG: hypothetical protein ACK5ZJ_24850 [Acidobacteriota bacterium]